MIGSVIERAGDTNRTRSFPLTPSSDSPSSTRARAGVDRPDEFDVADFVDIFASSVPGFLLSVAPDTRGVKAAPTSVRAMAAMMAEAGRRLREVVRVSWREVRREEADAESAGVG